MDDYCLNSARITQLYVPLTGYYNLVEAAYQPQFPSWRLECWA